MEKILWFAPLLLCLLMHVFMMKGHGDHDPKKKNDKKGLH